MGGVIPTVTASFHLSVEEAAAERLPETLGAGDTSTPAGLSLAGESSAHRVCGA